MNKVSIGEYNTLVNKYNEVYKENQGLKKQVEKRTKMYQNAYDYSQKMEGKTIILETQQKEFIKWLENVIEKVKNTEFLDERIQRAGLIAYNRCLQKYKSIIGVSDENNIK